MAKKMFDPFAMNAVTADAFRSLRANVTFAGGDQDIQTIVITSAVPHEGKTSITLGLGIAIARSGKKVLLVECDCRMPALGNRMKIHPKKTWVDVIYKEAELGEAIAPTKVKGMFFLDTSLGMAHSLELLSSQRFWNMIERLKQYYDYILFDTPPVSSFIEAAVVADHTDGSVLVVKNGSKEIRAIQQACEQMKKAKARLLGIVLNQTDPKHSSYYRYGGYYYYSSDGTKKRVHSRHSDEAATADKTEASVAEHESGSNDQAE